MKTYISRLRNSRLIPFFWSHYRSSEMSLSSIAVAYYLLLTVFPFLTLLAHIFPYVNIDTTAFLTVLGDSLPQPLYEGVAEVVQVIFEERSDGMVFLSVVTGFWTMSRGLAFLQKAINKAYDVDSVRDAFVGRLISLLSSFFLVALVILAVLLGIFGRIGLDMLYRYFPFDSSFYQLLRSLTQPLMFLVFVLGLGLLYYMMPNVRIVKWRYLLPGTLLTSLVILLLVMISEHYMVFALKRIGNLRFIGSVVTFAVLFWFIVLSKVVIVGAILNAAYQNACEDGFLPRRGQIRDFLEAWSEQK